MLKDPLGKKELEEKLKESLTKLKEENLIDENYKITRKGLEVAIVELIKMGKYKFGEKIGKGWEKELIGSKKYSFGDSLLNLHIPETIKAIAKYGKIDTNILRVKEFESKAGKEIILLVDASGSMKGEKFEKAVEIALNLATDLLKKGNRVGLILFSDRIIKEIKPTKRLDLIEEALIITPKGKTNLSIALKEALSMIGPNSEIIIISDAVPTDESAEEVIDTAKQLALKKVKVHVIGINLKEGREIARKIAKITGGTFQEI